MLEAQELGIGTLYIGGFDAKKAGSVLSVPEGYSCVILLLLGYPDEQPEARQRKEVSEIIFKNKFGMRIRSSRQRSLVISIKDEVTNCLNCSTRFHYCQDRV